MRVKYLLIFLFLLNITALFSQEKPKLEMLAFFGEKDKYHYTVNHIETLDKDNICAIYNSYAKGHIKISNDGGKSWETIFNAPEGNYMKRYALQDIAFPSQNTIIAVGDSTRIFRTTDRGKTWDTTDLGFWFPLRYIDFYDSNNGIISYLPNKILKTTNAGESWDTLMIDNENFIIDRIFYHSLDTIVATSKHAQEEKNWFVLSTDGGNSWPVQINLNCKYRDRAIEYINNLEYYFSYYEISNPAEAFNDILLVSRDGGESCEEVFNVDYGGIQGIQYIDFFDKTKGYAAGSNDVFYTEDAGETWDYFFADTLYNMDWPTTHIHTLRCFDWLEGRSVIIGSNHMILKLTLPWVTSVEEETALNNFDIFPNPASEFISINIPFTGLSKIEMTIHDIIGTKIYKKTLNQAKEKIDIGSLTPGIYFVTITTGSQIHKKKFVKY